VRRLNIVSGMYLVQVSLILIAVTRRNMQNGSVNSRDIFYSDLYGTFVTYLSIYAISQDSPFKSHKSDFAKVSISSSQSLFIKCCDHSVLDRKNGVEIRNRILRNPCHDDKPNPAHHQNDNKYMTDTGILCSEVHNSISSSLMLSANYTVQ
jgi:hypothetical protein